MFKLSTGDLWRGMVMAVLSSVVVAVLGVLNAVVTQNFDAFSTDYLQVLKDLTNAMIVSGYSSGAAYLLKNMLTDDNQNFLGINTKS